MEPRRSGTALNLDVAALGKSDMTDRSIGLRRRWSGDSWTGDTV